MADFETIFEKLSITHSDDGIRAFQDGVAAILEDCGRRGWSSLQGPDYGRLSSLAVQAVRDLTEPLCRSMEHAFESSGATAMDNALAAFGSEIGEVADCILESTLHTIDQCGRPPDDARESLAEGLRYEMDGAVRRAKNVAQGRLMVLIGSRQASNASRWKVPESSMGRLALLWSGIAAVSVFLGWLLVNGDVALKNYRSFQAWARNDAAFTGTWANKARQGHIGIEGVKQPSDVLWLSIKVDNGTINGAIHGAKLCEFTPNNYLSFDGDNSLLETRGRAYDYVLGKEKTFATFLLSLSKDHQRLTIRTLGAPSSMFPVVATLSRISDVPDDSFEDVPAICANYPEKVTHEVAGPKIDP
jgi:hypothetical protein